MVLKAQIGGYDIGQVFMDASSGKNLIYARTLNAMSISLENLQPIDCSLHGIVPGSANYPSRKLNLMFASATVIISAERSWSSK
jgi:hypothetical protein